MECFARHSQRYCVRTKSNHAIHVGLFSCSRAKKNWISIFHCFHSLSWRTSYSMSNLMYAINFDPPVFPNIIVGSRHTNCPGLVKAFVKYQREEIFPEIYKCTARWPRPHSANLSCSSRVIETRQMRCLVCGSLELAITHKPISHKPIIWQFTRSMRRMNNIG